MPDDARLANSLGMVALGVTTDLAARVEDVTGLALREVAALTTLANWSDGRSIEVLRAVLDMSQPGCARLVDRLAGAGLVRRAVSPSDRRVTTVSITARGRTQVRRARAAREQAVAAWLDGLAPADVTRLQALLDTIAAGRVGATDDGAAVANRLCRLCDVSACGFPDDCAVTGAVGG